MGSQQELENQIALHLASPQKSERWAMYRVIVPVVDFANESLGLEAYFEFNQTSAHGTSQSVDIALLENEQPVAMIEAKRVDRKVSSEQIDKYLPKGNRGIVTNGVNWVLCFEGQSRTLSIWSESDRSIDSDAISEVVSFLRGIATQGDQWTTTREYAYSKLKPRKPAKKMKAKRQVNTIRKAADVEACIEEVRKLERATESEVAFLRSLVESLSSTFGGIPDRCRLEFRPSRVSFFDKRVRGRSKRVGRIELSKQQPDILVATSIVDKYSGLAKLANPEPHDKGPHMRRFRLASEDDSVSFGRELGRVLFQQPN